MSSLMEFFNSHDADGKGIAHKNNLIKRSIIAYMAANGESTLADLSILVCLLILRCMIQPTPRI